MESGDRFRLALPDGLELSCRWRPGEASAPTLLYLHGFGSSQDGEKASFFRARAADEGLGFLSLDFRGHGASGGDLLGLTLTRCLEDVAMARAWLTARGDDRVAVVGSSMGGLVGLWHAALEPAGVEAGLYIAPAVGLAEDLEGLVGAAGMRQWRRRGDIEFANELGAFLVGWGLYRDLARYPTARLVELHRVPSLLFQGRLDDRVSWRRVAGFAAGAGGAARLRLFADGDHRLIDRREEMWAEMLSFLRAPATTRAARP